jgi:hypothetical protein
MKKLFLLVLSFLFSFTVFTSPAFAQGDETHVVLKEDQTINSDYFASGDTVTILGTINGDAYVAGGTIFFDGTVNGDIIAAGGTITIRGTAQNVRVAGGTIMVDGTIERNLTVTGGTITISDGTQLAGSLVAGGGTITVSSPIGKGATIGGGTVTIAEAINGNVFAGVGELILAPQAQVSGDLTYASKEEARISEGATVSGKLTHTIPDKPKREDAQETFLGLGQVALFFKLFNAVSMLIIGLLLIGLAPVFVKRVADGIVAKPWQSLGVGIVTLILAPIVFVILLLTIIGIPLAFIFLTLYLITLCFAKLFVIYLLGERIGRTLHPKLHIMLMFLIGLVIYEIITFIPIVGWLVELAALVFGLGSLLIQKKELYSSLRKAKTI